MPLRIKPRESCRWDALALGEVMLRLDPGCRPHPHRPAVHRLGRGAASTTSSAASRSASALRTAVVTALVANEVGHLVEDLMMQGGVDLIPHPMAPPSDGIGRAARIGLELHRTRLRHPRRRGLLGPRPLGRLAVEAGRYRLEADL